MNQGVKKFAKQMLFKLNQNYISKKIYRNEIIKRSRLPFTDIDNLAKDINAFAPYSQEIHQPNDFYGHGSAIRKYLDLSDSFQFKFAIEHGVAFIPTINDLEEENPFKAFVVMSNFRVNILKKIRPYVFPIGPYIYYAEHALSKTELKKEKARLGKTLLVFTLHSTPDVTNNYNEVEFCKKIKKISKGFDTVRICLYWKDVLLGKAKTYQEFGFECVTAGHVYDPFFLRRLKSIIELSDLTVSNDVGTSTGYAVLMKKPHFIMQQKTSQKGRKAEVELVQELYESDIFKHFAKVFDEPRADITKKQYKLVDEFWGLGEIKNKRQLKSIIDKTDKIYMDF